MKLGKLKRGLNANRVTSILAVENDGTPSIELLVR